MDELLDYFEGLLSYAQKKGPTLNAASQKALGQLISQFQKIIEAQQEKGATPAEAPSLSDGQVPSDARLLWILAGQRPQAFISYLRTYPTPGTQYLLSDPSALNSLISRLSSEMPEGQPPPVNGIPHAELNSSNVWGAAYDPRSGKMKVRFQGGSEYEYDGVPENIFKAFIRGNASARTKGKNKYGEWWVGKNPSLGAALNQYIKDGGFSYRKIR